MRFELGAQHLAQVGHLVEVGDVAVVDPLHHLVRAVALFAERVGEKVFQPRTIEVQEVLLGCCGFVLWTFGSKKLSATDRHGCNGSKRRKTESIASPSSASSTEIGRAHV